MKRRVQKSGGFNCAAGGLFAARKGRAKSAKCRRKCRVRTADAPFALESLEPRLLLSTGDPLAPLSALPSAPGTAPTVVSTSVNGGDAQRSRVMSVQTVFSDDVSGTLSEADFFIRNLTTGAVIDTADLTLNYDPPSNTANLTFPGLAGGSLPDGNYVVALVAGGIETASGDALDGNGDGTAGDSFAFDLFSHFGDKDGDRDVDFGDDFDFRDTYLKSQGDAEFDPAFDHDANAFVDTADLSELRKNHFTVRDRQPGVFAALSADTGIDATDGITSDPTISGTVLNRDLIWELRFGPDGAGGALIDITGDLQPDGTFTLDLAAIESVQGGGLTKGGKAFHFETRDSLGGTSSSHAVLFDFDVAAPVLQGPRGSMSAAATLDVTFDESVASQAFQAASYGLQIVGAPTMDKSSRSTERARSTRPPRN